MSCRMPTSQTVIHILTSLFSSFYFKLLKERRPIINDERN